MNRLENLLCWRRDKLQKAAVIILITKRKEQDCVFAAFSPSLHGAGSGKGTYISF